MTTTARSASNDKADLEAIVEGIAALKHDLAVLTNRLKQAGSNGSNGIAQEAIAELSDHAERIYGSLAARGQKTAKSIARKVEEQPMTALLIAFGVGLIGGRILSD